MSGDLETRVRRELHEMAARVEPDPHTWESIRQRASAPAGPRRAVVAAAAAVALVLLAAGTVILGSRGDDPRVTMAPAWSPEELQVRERVDVGPSPTSAAGRLRTKLASDGSQLWFAGIGSTQVARIDPVAASVASRTDARLPVVGIAVAPDSIWAVADGYAEIVRIDRRTGAVTNVELRTGDQRHPAAGGLTYGDQAVWVPVVDGGLARIDLETGAVEVMDLGTPVRFVTAGGGMVWGVGEAGTVVAFDPEQRAVTRRTELGAGEYRIEYGEGAVWVLDSRGELVRLSADLRSQRRTTVGPEPQGLATGAGAVWVIDRLDGELVIVDPESVEVRARVDIGGRPDDVIVAGDQIWISDPDAGILMSVPLR